MTSLPRVGEVSRLRIVEHAVTEVGDGKNLVDTDFQQVTMSGQRPGNRELDCDAEPRRSAAPPRTRGAQLHMKKNSELEACGAK